jgi:putative SOS response-associated peptidase YedK
MILDWDAHYNIVPTQNVPVIRQDAKEPIRRASLMRWGLVPHWANDLTIGARMINARAETAAEKPAFKESLERRRCSRKAHPCEEPSDRKTPWGHVPDWGTR